MAIRTTAELVKGILVHDYDKETNPSLDPYIETASVLVDRLASTVTSLTSTELAVIEKWLAAHFYTCMDQTYASRSTGGASGSFHGQTGQGLKGSKYGMAAISLDYSGTLASWDSGAGTQQIEFNWLGKRVDQQIPYWNRN